MTDCERCGWPLGPREGRWLDGDYVCPLCVEEAEFVPTEEERPPAHAMHWAWEGER